MSDTLERLKLARTTTGCYQSMGCKFEQLIDDAADEIDRLRTELAELRAKVEAQAVQRERLEKLLNSVDDVLHVEYNKAVLVCCGRRRSGECCGDPEPGWPSEAQAVTDALAPIRNELAGMLACIDQPDQRQAAGVPDEWVRTLSDLCSFAVNAVSKMHSAGVPLGFLDADIERLLPAAHKLLAAAPEAPLTPCPVCEEVPMADGNACGRCGGYAPEVKKS